MSEQTLRLFVSSPGDVADERHRVDLVIERLNIQFAGRVRIETIRWELSYYSAHETFQKQIPEAADCDVVVAVFRGRLGTKLPVNFPPSPSGEPYPSGSAYEVLSAIAARQAGKPLPDVYVFRYPKPPLVELDAPERAEIEAQWEQLKSFFDRWFKTPEGEFIAAFQTYNSTDDLAEKVEECLRQWLARRGYLTHGAVWDRLLHGSPFPGLAAFEAARASVFFGRDLAIGHAVERLRSAGGRGVPFLLVIGASGSGKSSLLRAGLLPRLVLPGTIPEIDLWRIAVCTPGPDPFLTLAESLLADTALGAELRRGSFRTRELLAKQLAGDPDTALAPLRHALGDAADQRRGEAGFAEPRPARLALAIDQAERLFVETDAKTAAAMAELLAALVRQDLAYLMMTLRSDAYPQYQAVESLVALRDDGATLDLVPPSAAELVEMVTQPVAACQPPLAFEQLDRRSLAERLVIDAKGGDALPLLQVTLERLYAAAARRRDGVLRFADYRGMDAAVTETANEALGTVDAASRAELPALVAALIVDVSTDPQTGALAPIVAPLDRRAFEAKSPARPALVKAFVDKRLLTAEGDEFSQRVRPVHEALLRIWPTAVEIVRETASLIRVRYALEPLVREWSEAGEGAKAEHLEISPALLGGAQEMVERFGADVPEVMRDFVAQAAAADATRRDREREQQERRIRDAEALAAANRRTAQRTLAGLVAALAFAALAGWQWREAGTQRDEAAAQRDRAQRSLALATDTANGLVFRLAQRFRNVVGVPAETIKDILDRARQLQDQLVGSGESTPDLRRSQAAALNETVATLLSVGDTRGALAAAERSRSILEALLKAEPANAGWLRDLSISHLETGDVEAAQGNLPDALTSYRAAAAILTRLNQADPGNPVRQHDLSVSHVKIGDVQQAQGDLTGALTSYQTSLAITNRLARADPSNDEWQRELSASYNNIGGVQQAEGNLPAALTSYQASLAIADRLAQADRGNAGWQRDLLVSYTKIGIAQQTQGNLPAALKSFQASLAIADRLVQADPGNAVWQRDRAISYDQVGDVLLGLGNLPAALTSYQAAHDALVRLVGSDPNNAGWQRDLALSDVRIGNSQLAQGNLAAAKTSFQASLVIRGRLVETDPGNVVWQQDLAFSYGRLALVEAGQGAREDALGALRAGRDIIARLAAQSPTDPALRKELARFDDRITALAK